MHRYVLFAFLLTCSAGAHALESIRIGSQVLSVGDSAARVRELMGKPVVHSRGSAAKSARKARKPVGQSKRAAAKEQGEQWQYRREGHTTIFTIANGKLVHIEDMAR
ncbi:DUF2845 domain-containing protein [Dyella acidiphila]|uniref:DUF2845 domain-containing protein n=1 Tax=Dyella acidiphila TaxID=2775866 RepID=A0ABR9G5D5_9GAMM|nr:DUF2845 domain-containing protein [Dyella acidiphila]MBE1159256.1 DUF2845 domain-containing protein [Dyella acidiphila]